MALRPVSELGLVDLTDLASPENAHPVASADPPPNAHPVAPADPALPADPVPPADADRPTEQPPRKSTTRRKPDGPRTSARTGSARKTSRPAPAKAARSLRVVEPEADTGNRSRAGSEKRRIGPSHRTASIGISALAGAVGVAAGVLLSRGELHR